jgi:hypothetical protein
VQPKIKLAYSDPQLGCGISAEEIRSALSTILSSRTFKSARGQSKFLAYVVTQSIAGRFELIKEYWVGREALGRGDSFDPRFDPIVRTQARKLRLRLAKYYQTEGAYDRILIQFPKGSYVPVYRRAQGESETAMDIPEASVPILVASVVAKDTSFLRSSASIVIPICVVGAALAVVIYRLLN